MLTNYLLEDNTDFYKELKRKKSTDENVNCCLLSHEPLSDNYITLPCNHTFNYIPLCNEMSTRQKAHSKFKYCKPLTNKGICCPYCRKKYTKLLPYIPIYNYPYSNIFSASNCIELHKCEYCIKSGKNRNKLCTSNNAFKSKHGVLCTKHFTLTERLEKRGLLKQKILNSKDGKNLMGKKKIELQNMLREKSLPLSGTKSILVDRLLTL